jgi:hypothetical protein
MERMNRTGTSLKPGECQEMVEGVAEFPPPRQNGDGELILAMRGAYIRQGEPVGSIPLPPSPRGAGESAKGARTGQQPLILADKLGERLAFERTGTRLYQGFLGKLASADGQAGAVPVREVERIMQDEHEHFLLLRQTIEQLGGDATAVTPAADVAGVTAMGILQVITDPRTTVDQCLCALLTAELADNDGWDLLITLAEGLGHRELAKEFGVALADEGRHLELVRGWVQQGSLTMAGITAKPRNARKTASSSRSSGTRQTSGTGAKRSGR